MYSFRISILFLLGLLCAPLSTISAQGIPEEIDSVLDGSATLRPYRWGILMENADGSSEYYSRSPDTGMIPASNTKLFTTAAAFGLLGPDYQFRTRTYRTTGTITGGVFTGNIILLGEHDITWNTNVFGSNNANAALRLIATRTVQALAAAGITTVNGRVEGHGAMLYNLSSTNTGHVSTGTTTVTTNNRLSAEAFRAALIAAGLTFSTTEATVGATGFTPSASWTLLHTHMSGSINRPASGRALTLAEACIGLNKPSHNPMADHLLRHIGYTLRGTDSYSAGAQEAFAWFRDVAGMSTTGMVMNDGSGLSGGNRFSARQTVDLIRYMSNTSQTWVTTLPISCVDGTMGSRLCNTMAGRVLAKTGSLPNTGVISLAGMINHPSDGQRYYFAFYANTPGSTSGGEAIDDTATRTTIDSAVRVLGDRIPVREPVLLSLRHEESDTVRIEWTDPFHTLNGFQIKGSSDASVYTDQRFVGPAYVIESGRSDTNLGLNNADYTDTGAFEDSTTHSTAPGLTPGIGSRFLRPTNGVGSAFFTPSALPAGRYRVDVSCYNFVSAHATRAQVLITDARGSTAKTFTLSYQTAGNRWRPLGEFDFRPGQNHRVEIRNHVQSSTGTDDRLNPAAVRFVPLYAVEPAPAPGVMRHYEVGVSGPRNLTGPVSDSYAFVTGPSRRVLVVDGYDRWNRFTSKNPTASSHRFASRTAAAISGSSIDSVANEVVQSGAINLAEYDAVVWGVGEESTTDETLSSQEQTRLSTYLNAGGSLFISGSEIGWDLGRAAAGPTTTDRAFMRNILRAEYDPARSDNLNDASGTNSVRGDSASIMSAIGSFTFDNGTGGIYSVGFPDVLKPFGAGSVVALRYVGGTGNELAAAIAYDGSAGGGRVIFLGFPFETILSESVCNAIMSASMDFLAPSAPLPTATMWMLLAE